MYKKEIPIMDLWKTLGNTEAHCEVFAVDFSINNE